MVKEVYMFNLIPSKNALHTSNMHIYLIVNLKFFLYIFDSAMNKGSLNLLVTINSNDSTDWSV
jgi:hypothetical protein